MHTGTLYEDIGSVAGALKQQQANKVWPCLQAPPCCFACAVLPGLPGLAAALVPALIRAAARLQALHHTHSGIPAGPCPAHQQGQRGVTLWHGAAEPHITVQVGARH